MPLKTFSALSSTTSFFLPLGILNSPQNLSKLKGSLQSKSMSNGSFKSVPNLYPVTEGIIAINRVTALFVPGNFRWIRTPVVFFSVEPFKNRRIQFRRDPEIDVRPLHRARAPFCDLIHFAQNHELSRVRHREGNLAFAGHLPALR